MKRPTLRLFLTRHGETLSNREMRYLGTLDEPLSPTGVEQADRLASWLAPVPLAAVYSSPLRRALDTGRRLAEARQVEVRLEPRLREQAFGEWEGLTRPEVLERDRDRLLGWEADLGLAPPGGESLAAVQERVLSLVEDLAREHPGGWIALVSHVGPIKALLCAALGAPLATARRMFLDPATVTVLDWGSHPVIRLFNAHASPGWEPVRWMAQGPSGP